MMEANGLSSSLARWSERLKDLTLTPLTRDYPDPSSEEAARTKRPIEAIETHAAPESLSHLLRNLHELGTPYELLLTAYVILISRLTGDDDITLGTNIEPDGQPIVLRVSISPQETFNQLLSKVKEVSRMLARVRSLC
jgi:L-2-aminoadipate reductase